MAVLEAPGVPAVEVDYETKRATIGTKADQPIPKEEILAALRSIGYDGEFIE